MDKDAADIEDIIDGELYHRLFKMRYPNILREGTVPPDDKKKRIMYYQKLLSEEVSESKLDKGGIAKYLMDVVRHTTKDSDIPLRRTMDNYEKLVGLIEKKLNMATNGS